MSRLGPWNLCAISPLLLSASLYLQLHTFKVEQWSSKHRHTSFYFIEFHCIVLQILHFLFLFFFQIEGLWQPCVLCLAIVPIAFAHFMFFSHILVILVPFQTFNYYYIYSWCDQLKSLLSLFGDVNSAHIRYGSTAYWNDSKFEPITIKLCW